MAHGALAICQVERAGQGGSDPAGAGIKKIRWAQPARNSGATAQPTLLIVDAQSVKNADTAGSRGHDAGKKVSGIKVSERWLNTSLPFIHLAFLAMLLRTL